MSDFGRFIQRYFGDFSSFGLHYNWLVILFFLFVIFLVGFSLGRTRMLLGLLSIYIAAFITPLFSYRDRLGEFFKNLPDYWLNLSLFLVVYLIVFLILNRSLLKHRLSMKESSPLTILGIAILEIGFLTTIAVSYLPEKIVASLSPQLLKYFGSKNSQFIWSILPLLAVLFLKGRKEGRKEIIG